MSGRPILFSGEMVRAILEGEKTQTRRVLRPQPDSKLNYGYPQRVIDRFRCVGTDVAAGKTIYEAGNFAGPIYAFPDGKDSVKADITCPYGQVGDRLWVRESALYLPTEDHFEEIKYADDEDFDLCLPTKGESFSLGWKMRPSIHMPRWASRISLEITGIRVERLKEITHEDALAEGVPDTDPADDGIKWGAWDAPVFSYALARYRHLWDSLNSNRGFSWESNPWVWVVEFRRVS